MMNTAYRLAAQVAVARQVRGLSVQTRAALPRLQALHRLNLGTGLVTLPPAVPPAVRHSAPHLGDQRRGVGDRASPFARHGAVGIVQRRTLARLAGGNRSSPYVALAGLAPAARFVGAGRNGTGPAPLARARRVPFVPAVTARLPAMLAWRDAVGSAPSGARLAASTTALAGASRRIASIALPSIAARARHHAAAPTPQPAATPGFQRTVRQPQAKAAAGHVYLDKTLVGYHLAAAITAEQTRAAARPNISGSLFNSSMAALRPSGAGI